MYKRYIIGKFGEDIAVKYLLENNYEIIERNFECRQGEIDIIAKDKNEIVFIEVKSRTNNLYGTPAEAVSMIKGKHIIGCIKYYLYINNIEDIYVRIDVIEVYMLPNKNKVYHIKNAIMDT